MKTPSFTAIIALFIYCASAQTEPAHEWNVTLKVVDDTGQPVIGAEAWVNYLTNQFTGLTDQNGVFMASHLDQSAQLSFQVQKAGYYTFGMIYFMGFRYDQEKWNPTVDVLLKRIIDPIPMYAKQVNLGMPVFDKPAGFDLMVGDWVAPYGKGANIDINFTAHREKRAKNDSDYKLVVNFPNQGDGIQNFIEPRTSNDGGLRSPYKAPAEGYQPDWTQVKKRRPGQPMQGNFNMGRNFFFRVRTVVDQNGNVKSALYGKIYGDFLQFTYYLNPTPNSRNVEFDPKHNLLGGLKSFEQVTAP